MSIFAQVGYGPKDKLTRGLEESVISGAILSPRYIKGDVDHLDQVQAKVLEIQDHGGRVLMDPELYATRYISHPSPNLGNLETWDYFNIPRRSTLISGAAIPGVIKSVLQAQKALGLSEWIAPNVFIDSADSIETAISLGFIGRAKQVAQECGGNPVFATLALSRNAILSKTDFQDFFDALTSTETPPDGYYILVGSEGSGGSGNQIRSEIYHPEVIAGWMYMNYVLSINGARVLNGYCHLLGPLMGMCGAETVSSGWFSGLRCFSMSKFVRRAGGGRLPVVRYVSNSLFARIKWTNYIDFKEIVPEISNNLKFDYSPNKEPSRTEEALQSWEALSALWENNVTGKIEDDLTTFCSHLEKAKQQWMLIREAGFSEEVEPNLERLEIVENGIAIFREWAELA